MNVSNTLRSAHVLAMELTQGKPGLPAELQNAIVEGGPLDQATFTPALVQELDDTLSSPTTFVSTPITGGPRLLAFLEKQNLHELQGGVPVMDAEQRRAYFAEVVIPNQAHANEVTAKVRQNSPTLESADTEMLPGFTNPDYNRHWMDVVSNTSQVNKILACDGWQFSFGTILELRAGLDRGLAVQDERGQAIDLPRARTEVAGAIAEAARHGLDFSRLGSILDSTDPRSGPMSL